jgi:hypothetical protein
MLGKRLARFGNVSSLPGMNVLRGFHRQARKPVLTVDVPLTPDVLEQLPPDVQAQLKRVSTR